MAERDLYIVVLEVDHGIIERLRVRFIDQQILEAVLGIILVMVELDGQAGVEKRVIPDQIFDHTKGRERSFFGEGLVAHISLADPFCPDLSSLVATAVLNAGGSVHQGGAFITIEGPRFSTRVESNTYRAWGMSIIGMTTSPEAFLAREAEMCYAVMAHVTDYDVWHISEDPVTVEMVIRILLSNTALAQHAIKNLVLELPLNKTCDCGNALRDALITDPKSIPQETRERLSILVERYLP